MKDKSAIILTYLLLTLTSILIFVGVCAVTYERTRKAMMENADQTAALNLEIATKLITAKSEKVAVAGFSLASMACNTQSNEQEGHVGLTFVIDEKRMERPEGIYLTLERFLEANPQLWGAAIGFEPGVFKSYGKDGFAPFVRHEGNTYTRFNLPQEGNLYREKDWYKETKRLGTYRWSEPFLDVRGAAISSFCIPIYNKSGDFVGTIAVDLELSKFSAQLNNGVHPYENSSIVLLNDKLQVIAHPETDRILNQTMSSLQEWKEELKEQGILLYSSRIPGPGWTVALTCPEEKVLEGTHDLVRQLFIIAIIGILLSSLASMLAFSKIRKFATNQISVNRDIHIASVLQQNMLPHNFPSNRNFKLGAVLQPAKEVGGDLYDYFEKDGHLIFAIGDVSGKGVPAAIFMAVTKAVFRSNYQMNVSPSEVAARINNQIAEGNDNGMFVTMFFGDLDLESGELRFCNAGHNPIVIIPAESEPYFLKAEPNIALGLFPDFNFKEETMTIDKGSRLVLYTDGVTEAETSDKRQYGEDRLIEWCRHTNEHSGSAKSAADALLSNVQKFTGGNEQNDDITIMTIRLG